MALDLGFLLLATWLVVRWVALADGRIVVGEAAGARTVLRVFTADGVPRDEIDLDRVPSGLGVGPEVAPGKVAVRLASETVVVDLAERTVVETLPGLHPLRGFWFLGGPGSAGTTTHFFMNKGKVLQRDFATGEERVVAGPGASAGERLDLH